jgi:hypothetical protein
MFQKTIDFKITLLFQIHSIFLAIFYQIQRTFKFELSTHFIGTRKQDMVNIVTTISAGQSRNCGSIPDRGRNFFIFFQNIQTCSGPAQGTGSPFLGTKLLRSEAGYRSSSSAKVANEWNYNCTPHMPT